MDTRLTDVLQNREQNYLLPFFWQQGNHTELLEKQIEEIYQSGCRAFCVERITAATAGGATWISSSARPKSAGCRSGS